MNKGLEQSEVARVKKRCEEAGRNFIYNTDEERDENFAHFFFVGQHEGEEVVFNGFMYSLEMEYISTLYDEAQSILIERVPEFKEEDFESESAEVLAQIESVVAELEDSGEIQVQEFVEVDSSVEYGIGINVCLNLLEITDEDISAFVKGYTEDTLKLDTTSYSFDFDEDAMD